MTATNNLNKLSKILLGCAAKSRTLKYILMVCHGQCSVVITHALGPHFTDLHLNDAPSHGQDTVVPYIASKHKNPFQCAMWDIKI